MRKNAASLDIRAEMGIYELLILNEAIRPLIL